MSWTCSVLPIFFWAKGSKYEGIVQVTNQLRHGEEGLCQVRSKSDVNVVGIQHRIQLNPLLKNIYMSQFAEKRGHPEALYDLLGNYKVVIIDI